MSAPILVVWDSQTPHRFASYVTEILALEGYNWYAVHDLSTLPLSAETLGQHAVVITTHVDLSDATQEALLAYVRGGGRLIALRPPERFAAHFGLTSTRFDLADRYLSLNPLCALNAGVEGVPPSLQFHGRGELYAWAGSVSNVLASFQGVKGNPTAHPAITIGQLGQGAWAVFAYDLAESTVLFHQGRVEQISTAAGRDADADRKYTLSDHFVGYLDADLCRYPQADLHQDVLVRVLEWMTSLRAPLPRLWHYPHGAPAVAWFRGDGDYMSVADFENTIATAERFGIPFTTYLMLDDHTKVSPERLAALRARGHDFGQHVYCGDTPTPERMRAALRDEHAAFRERYGHAPLTYCGHGRVWVGWAEMARYLYENGVRFSGSYGPGRFFHHGYLGGSGLPVRFVDEQGEVIDVYHQNILSSDDGWVNDKLFFPAQTIDECLALSEALVDDAVDRFHTVYHGSFHPVRTRPGGASTQRWLEGIMRHVRERGLHAMSGSEWVRFNDARRGARLIDSTWEPAEGVLDVTLETPSAAQGLTLALPHVFRGRALTRAALDGEEVPVTCLEPRTLEGRQQVLLEADYAAGQRRRWSFTWTSAENARG